MKEAMMLVGFGMGLIAGAMLYKYSSCAKKVIDQSEKKVKQEIESMEKQAEQSMQEKKSK